MGENVALCVTLWLNYSPFVADKCNFITESR